MVIVNFGVVMTGAEWGSGDGGGRGWMRFATGLFEGRAAATFVVLAGIGMTLGARRAVTSGEPERLVAARNALWKRSAWLFVGGLAFAALWPADILHFYGVWLAVGALMLGWTDRRLLAVAALVAACFPILLLLFDFEAGWNFETLTYTGFWTLPGQIRNLFFNGFHPVIPWLSFLVLGLWLGRRNLLDRAVRRRVLIVGAAAAASAEAISAGLTGFLSRSASTEDAELIDALFGTGALPPMPLYLIAAGGTALAVIALAVSISQRFSGFPGHAALVATGRCSLTIYVAHVVFGMGTLEAFGRLENQTPGFAAAAATAFFAVSVIFSALWLRRFQRGPLEWLLRTFARTRRPSATA